MDWLEPQGNKSVRLGVLRLAAKSTDKKFSPLFVNPGVSPLQMARKTVAAVADRVIGPRRIRSTVSSRGRPSASDHCW